MQIGTRLIFVVMSVALVSIVGASCGNTAAAPGAIVSQNVMMTHEDILAVKYVAYLDSKGAPVVSQTQAQENLNQANRLFAPCKIGFVLEDYVPANSLEYGLAYQTSELDDMDKIREDFSDDATFLITTTGTWDRSGTLGNTPANAWTSVPGSAPFGIILERSVGTYSNLVAHELGHYVGLFHRNETQNLMNPIIYQTSTQVTDQQCLEAKTAVQMHWQKMLREPALTVASQSPS
ncbi:matrixin family metalloprotease [Bdellovibrionota bacterium FG-2]